jgi:hypothetical protein
MPMSWTHCQCEPVKAKQSRSMAWMCCGGLTERRGTIWHGRLIMASAPEKWKIGIFNSTPSDRHAYGHDNAMRSRILEVVGRFGSVPQH